MNARDARLRYAIGGGIRSSRGAFDAATMPIALTRVFADLSSRRFASSWFEDMPHGQVRDLPLRTGFDRGAGERVRDLPLRHIRSGNTGEIARTLARRDGMPSGVAALRGLAVGGGAAAEFEARPSGREPVVHVERVEVRVERVADVSDVEAFNRMLGDALRDEMARFGV